MTAPRVQLLATRLKVFSCVKRYVEVFGEWPLRAWVVEKTGLSENTVIEHMAALTTAAGIDAPAPADPREYGQRRKTVPHRPGAHRGPFRSTGEMMPVDRAFDYNARRPGYALQEAAYVER